MYVDDAVIVRATFLARLDEVQEELLYYPGVGVSKMLKFLRQSFLCDGQGAVCPCDRSCFIYMYFHTSKLKM